LHGTATTAEMESFVVSVTTGLRLQDFNVIVTPKEETTLTDLKEGEGDPVIKWSFSWSWEDRKYNTR
jgi:hypothetical protein